MIKRAIPKLKKEYIAYFEDVPVQKYAAMAIGRDEDTVMRWRKEDSAFAGAIQRAKARWVRKRLLATKAEFALGRLEAEVFSPRSYSDPNVEYELIRTKLRGFLDDTNDGAYAV